MFCFLLDFKQTAADPDQTWHFSREKYMHVKFSYLDFLILKVDKQNLNACVCNELAGCHDNHSVHSTIT